MLIGDSATYDGRTYIVVGFTPTSVKPAQIELSDPQTGTTFWVDLQRDWEPDALERVALRVVRNDRPSSSP